jgi:hypothetical protein
MMSKAEMTEGEYNPAEEGIRAARLDGHHEAPKRVKEAIAQARSYREARMVARHLANLTPGCRYDRWAYLVDIAWTPYEG